MLASSLPLSTSQSAFLHFKLLFQHLMPPVLMICNVLSSVIIPNLNLKSQWTVKHRVSFSCRYRNSTSLLSNHMQGQNLQRHSSFTQKSVLKGQMALGVEAVTQLMVCTWAWWHKPPPKAALGRASSSRSSSATLSLSQPGPYEIQSQNNSSKI